MSPPPNWLAVVAWNGRCTKSSFVREPQRTLRGWTKPSPTGCSRKIRWLAENFDSIKPEPLGGPLSGLYKLRVGDYRVVYSVDRDKKLLTVRLVGHRREIYERSR